MTAGPHQQPPTNVPQPDGLEVGTFRGIRYTDVGPSELAGMMAPPYDLIDGGAAQRLRAAHPHNVVRLIRPKEDDELDGYRSAGATLRRWLAEGVLAPDSRPALYVYEERSNAHTLRALVGTVALARAGTGIIQLHEETAPGPIADRLSLMRATEANLEPVLLLYEGGKTASGAGRTSALVEEVAASEQPVSSASAGDGTVYRLWAVTDPDRHVQVADDLFPRTALVADGHHRYAAALRFQAEQHAAGRGPGPWDYALAVLVDSSTHPPYLGAIHRVLPELPPDEAVERAREVFRVTSIEGGQRPAREALADAARSGPALLLVDPREDGDGHHLLTDPEAELLQRSVPPGHAEEWAQLSTAVLHRVLIPRIWGLNEQGNSVVTMHDDAADAYRAADRSGGTAVLMHPLHLADVHAVADRGEQMPRKSTSFGPKPPTGLVLRALDRS